MSTFYSLERNKRYPDVWYNDKIELHRTVVCPMNDGHQRAARNDSNLSIRIKSKVIGDFITTVYSDLLITDKVVNIFAVNKLTGYELRRVDVCNKDLPYNIWELIITGKGGEAHKDSGIVFKRQCEYCKHTVYSAFTNGIGIIVDENNWDGSDLFTINAYSKYILVNEKVKDLINNNGLKGVIPILSRNLIRNDRFGNEVSP